DDGGPLRIGALYPISGPVGTYGADELRGVETAVELVNADGGIGGAMGGRPVELIARDVPDLESGWRETHDLVLSERIRLVTGTYSSVVSLATTQAATDNGAIYWENGAVADLVITRRLSNVYRTGPSSAVLAGQALDFLVEEVAPAHGLSPQDLRLAVVYENGPYGTGVGQRVEAVASEHGVELVARLPYHPPTEDFTEPIRTLEETQPNAVIAATYLDDGVGFARRIHDADLELLALIGKCAAFFTPEFAAMLDGRAEGLFLSDKPMQVAPEALDDGAREVAERFERAYRSRFGEPNDASYTGFAGMWLLLTGVLPRLERLDAGAFRTAADALDEPLGALPNGAGARFAPQEHPFAGQNLRALGVIWQWQDGRPALVHPRRVATASANFDRGRVGRRTS
ncbi:MAG: ABC transporter substrate-binding protein, partial [Nitriliruptorales bacterium]